VEYILDDKDQLILDTLKERSDSTTRQIAKKTLLPPTTIHNRIRKLKEAGIIKRFTIEIDENKAGNKVSAYVLVSADLKLLKEKKKTQYDLANEIRKFGFVRRVDIVAGVTDLVAMVRVKDMEEFDKILLGKLQLIEGVDKTQTMIVIHEK
jgi:Lrp/AsnC family transcriptional regulator for asnA, asnC and gidA